MITVIMDYATCSPADIMRYVLLSLLNVTAEIVPIDSEIFEVVLSSFDGSDDTEDCVAMSLELMEVFGGMHEE